MKCSILVTEDSKVLKESLSELITSLVSQGDLSQVAIASILGVDQPKVSQLKNKKVNGFSLERLLRFLIKMNCKVSINVSKD